MTGFCTLPDGQISRPRTMTLTVASAVLSRQVGAIRSFTAIPPTMNPSLISGFAALAGAAVGGLTSALAAWFNQREMTQAQWFASETLRRQDVYREFIEIAAKCYIDALQHGNPDYPGLVGLYAKISRMRVLSSDEIVVKAEQVAEKILDTYSEPDKSFADLRGMARDHTIDLLHDFSDACRLEHERRRSRRR